MPSLKRRHAAPLAIFLLAISPGCGDGRPAVDTSMTEATVTGIVSVKGKPAEGGEIRFNPSNRQRIVPAKVAAIGADGSFTIKTLTGGNEVSFSGDVASKNSGVGLIKQHIEVKPGDNKVDFDLMGEGVRMPFPVPAKGRKGGR